VTLCPLGSKTWLRRPAQPRTARRGEVDGMDIEIIEDGMYGNEAS